MDNNKGVLNKGIFGSTIANDFSRIGPGASKLLVSSESNMTDQNNV